MSIESLKNLLPEYAKDLKLNLSNIAETVPTLSEQQHWGTLLASAIAARNERVLTAIAAEAAAHLNAEAQTAAKAAAAIMAMNNIYYRTMHMLSDTEYRTMPARLRMNVIARPGVEKLDFELWSLAVSAVNGCEMCVNAHEQGLRKEGLEREAIQDAIRIASIVHAVAATLEAEETLAAPAG